MARGRGSRMGGPKGLLRLPGADRTFLRVIIDTYLDRNAVLDVVVPEEHHGSHAKELPARSGCRILPAAAGGDTARTLLVSWRACLAEGRKCSHFWAHPVDLPLVLPETLALLEEASRRNPRRIIRPVRRGIPGHPVILPYDVLAALDRRPEFHEGPLRDFLRRGARDRWLEPPLEVEVEDPGIDRDFDRPGDLNPDMPPAGKDALHE